VTKSIQNAEMHIIVEFGVESNGVGSQFRVVGKRLWKDHRCLESNEQGLNCGVKPQVF